MRDFMDAVGATRRGVREGVEEVGNPSYYVFVDPSPGALTNLVERSADKIAKGLYDPRDKKLYVWDANYAAHNKAEHDLGLMRPRKEAQPVSLIIGQNEDGKMAINICLDDDGRRDPEVLNHPTLSRITFDSPDSSFMRRWR